MADEMQFKLTQDRKGTVWDLLLYIPTVVALTSIAAQSWYGGNQNMAYLLFFLACFFFLAGFNRIFKTRLMLLPTAPIFLGIGRQNVVMKLRNGSQVDLVKNVKYYSDYSGKTFGISGLDGAGKLLQFVFHKGQFEAVEQFSSAQDALKKQFNK